MKHRFVILEHDHPFLHWDLMLEVGEVLRTWRLLEAPAAGKRIAVESLGDHRKAYLDYEGSVSGGRGVVRRWDQGEVEWLEAGPERVVVRLRGGRVSGDAVIEGGGFRLELEESD
jgi:hypothetical protein